MTDDGETGKKVHKSGEISVTEKRQEVFEDVLRRRGVETGPVVETDLRRRGLQTYRVKECREYSKEFGGVTPGGTGELVYKVEGLWVMNDMKRRNKKGLLNSQIL